MVILFLRESEILLQFIQLFVRVKKCILLFYVNLFKYS